MHPIHGKLQVDDFDPVRWVHSRKCGWYWVQVRVEGGGTWRCSWEWWNVSSIYKDCGRKTCVKSIEIESGASHLLAEEASMSDAKRLYQRVGRGFYYCYLQQSWWSHISCAFLIFVTPKSLNTISPQWLHILPWLYRQNDTILLSLVHGTISFIFIYFEYYFARGWVANSVNTILWEPYHLKSPKKKKDNTWWYIF